MANEKTCAYCGTALGPGDEICPSCGAPNPHHVPGGEAGTGTRKPRTIEELRAFCDEAETLTSAEYWPFPTYGDLLFGV